MAQARLWKVDDPDLPENLHMIREVFMKPAEEPKREPVVQKDGRKEGESLHDYFMRKGIKCFCNQCRGKNVQHKEDVL